MAQSRLRTLTLNLCLMAAACLVALGIAEAAVRILAPSLRCVPWRDSMDGVTTLLPNVSGRCVSPGAFDTWVTINGQKFRGTDRNYSESPDPGILRIAAMGDSFTWGLGASDGETYPARLEHYLNRRTGGPRVEVINAGVPGTGTGEQALYYDFWVSRFRPKVVVLATYVNDVDDELSRRFFTVKEGNGAKPTSRAELRRLGAEVDAARERVLRIPGYAFLVQRLQLVGFLRNTFSTWLEARRAAKATGREALPEVTDPRWSADGLRLIAGELDWFAARLKRDGARLLLVHIPLREAIYPPSDGKAAGLIEKDRLLRAALSERSSLLGVEFLDLTDAVRQRASGAKLYVMRRDYHATAAGYDSFGELVAEWIAGRI